MKFLLTTFLTLFTTLCIAGPGMSEEQMQQMMQQAQAAQACFEKIDQSKFKELETKGKQMESEIKALCTAGKRDEAEKTAIKYGMEMNNDPALQEMKKCGEMMQGMMGQMESFMPSIPEVNENDDSHLCDDM